MPGVRAAVSDGASGERLSGVRLFALRCVANRANEGICLQSVVRPVLLIDAVKPFTQITEDLLFKLFAVGSHCQPNAASPVRASSANTRAGLCPCVRGLIRVRRPNRATS